MGLNINEELESYKDYVKNKVGNKRFIHSLGVSYTAGSLAMCYGCDYIKAQIAGILHDCAKGYKHDELVSLCRKSKIQITDTELASPELLHSKYGAYLIEHELKINDKEIVNAVLYHTTGRVNMTLLEKIIFVSDYIEPCRGNLPLIDIIRPLAYKDIDKAVALICKGSIEYLQKKGSSIDNTTIETYNFYNEKLEN